MFEVPQNSSNSNHTQSYKSRLCYAVRCLVYRNRSVLVLEVVVEARDQIPHDLLALRHSVLRIWFLLLAPT